MTLDDRQGVEAMRTVRPRVTIPVHFDDDQVFGSPLAAFQRRVHEAALADRVRDLARGERFELQVWGEAPEEFPRAPAPPV